MLRWRLLGALAIVSPVLLLMWLDGAHHFGKPGIWLLPLGFVLVAVASVELHRLAQNAGNLQGGPGLTILVGELCLLISLVPPMLGTDLGLPRDLWHWFAVGLMAALMVRMLAAMQGFHEGGQTTSAIAHSMFHAVYVVLPLLFLFQTRLLWPDARGLWAMASIPWVAKLSDTGAYFAGRAWGRHPMAVVLSPKKTWEGAVGGMLAAILASCVFFFVVTYVSIIPGLSQVNLLSATLFGAALGLSGILGDLSESLLKRDAGAKDAARWLPGLGGSLDVLDSILWAAPVGYCFWKIWLSSQA